MNKIKLRNSEFSNLRHRLELCGWKIVFFNTPEGDHLAQRLGVVDSTLKTDSFVCKIDTLQYIFINADLSAFEREIFWCGKWDGSLFRAWKRERG